MSREPIAGAMVGDGVTMRLDRATAPGPVPARDARQHGGEGADLAPRPPPASLLPPLRLVPAPNPAPAPHLDARPGSIPTPAHAPPAPEVRDLHHLYAPRQMSFILQRERARAD